MTRYYVRDLGRGLLEPGGINAAGAVVFTAIIEDVGPLAVTAMACAASPIAPVIRSSSDGPDHDGDTGDAIFRAHGGGIDQHGALVGTAVIGAPCGTTVRTVAIRFEAGHHRRTRHAPLPGFDASVACAVASEGAVVGASLGASTSVATLWRDREAIRLDAGLPGVTFSRAIAVNRRGTVLGLYASSSGAVRGFLRDANQGLEADVGPTGIDAFPTDLNDAGRVVGGAADQLAWYAQRSGSARRLTLLPGSAASGAWGVNNRGAIVGRCDGTACLWEHPEEPDQAPVDLNTRSSVPDRGRLHRAACINDAGLILCQGSSDRGPDRVYLLSPHAGAAPRVDDVPDGILFGLQPQAGVFGVRLAASFDDDGGDDRSGGRGNLLRGRVSLSKLCQLVSALDCPPCLGLVEAPCGPGWGVALEGLPEGMRVSLLGDHPIGDLELGPFRGDGAPFTSQAGARSVEIVFAPTGRDEYLLLFETYVDPPRSELVFPIRLTIFRDPPPEQPLTRASPP